MKKEDIGKALDVLYRLEDQEGYKTTSPVSIAVNYLQDQLKELTDTQYNTWGTSELIEELERRDKARKRAFLKYGDYTEAREALAMLNNK